MWFLVVGGIEHHSGGVDKSASIFWLFIMFVFIIPCGIALVMLGVVLHLVNYVSSLPFSFTLMWKAGQCAMCPTLYYCRSSSSTG